MAQAKNAEIWIIVVIVIHGVFAIRAMYYYIGTLMRSQSVTEYPFRNHQQWLYMHSTVCNTKAFVHHYLNFQDEYILCMPCCTNMYR